MAWQFIGTRGGRPIISVGRGAGSWTPQILGTKVLFWGKVSEITGGQMPNKVTGSTDYLTITGTGLNARYRTPDADAYRTADTDYCWWKTDASESTCDGNRLIAYDFARTIVKYDNTSPYTIREIIILSSALTTAEMNHLRDYADLSIWWDNTLSAHGNTKQNKPIAGQYVWTPESVGVYDADGNLYTTVVIGSQTWLVENLKTTKYNDLSTIDYKSNNVDWIAQDGTSGKDGSISYPNNNIANVSAYGLLYNWYAVNNAKGIAPSGYRVATQADFATLITELGGLTGMGAKMKEAGTTYWTAPNTGATNSSGFYGRGCGARSTDGTYILFKDYGIWHLADSFSVPNARRFYMDTASSDVANDNAEKILGYTVRCIKT